MSEKKYSLLTDSDIEKGLRDELFQKENIALIRDNEGKIVRHLPITCLEKSIIPPTLIQINSTYIYQADIKPVIDAIIETKNIELFEDLEEKYQIVIDNLTYYKDHNNRLDELNSKSLDASSVFEKRTERYLANIDINKLGDVDIDRCLTMLDSYVNILFIYIISTYWLHKENISNDTIAKKKIINFEEKVKNIYEQLLTESWIDENNTNRITMHNSLYSKFLLDEKGDGIYKIEKLLKHDSRFSSITEFMAFISRFFIKRKNEYNSYHGESQVRYEIEINTSGNNDEQKSNFAEKLFEILEKIEILKNIYSEVAKVGEIDLEKIKIYADKEANKALHLTAIPLALHSGR